MAPKQQLEKQTWQWAETTDPANVTPEQMQTVYRIGMKACKRNSCRRNCKGNPNCLNSIGEREWFVEIDDNVWHDIEDPESERRGEGAFVGLKNLGATCYVNTFIQVWFHNPVFRHAVFSWRGEDGVPAIIHQNGEESNMVKEAGSTSPTPIYGPQPRCTEMAMAEDKDLMPNTVCGHLQHIFGLLQFSNRRYIDPSSFIECLGLNAAEQQDAQEFSKLFMSVLEDQLSQSAKSESSGGLPSKNLIKDQFQGEYAYVTTCSVCQSGSQRASDFYELDLSIKGHSNLNQCIEEFLEEEKLEDDNKYMCGTCNKKQNAVRCIKLRQLPKVLNLQLLRFVFDRKSGHKKKLNTFIQFPEILDLSEYVGEPEGVTLYQLAAVLIHLGPSAYSGHYVAHIRDTASESWFKFNDEEIIKMEGKNLQLGNEEDIGTSLTESKGPKKPRTPKGFHCSRNAYMLVYVKQGESKGPTKPMTVEMLPERLQLYLDVDRRRFEDWVREMSVMRDSNVTNGKERQQEIKQIYELLYVKPGEDYDWIDAGWLSTMLKANTAKSVPAIDNSSLCCPHGKLNPDQVGKVKRISSVAAEILYAKYAGQPRFKGDDALCQTCVVERCRVIRLKARLAEDQKVIAAALKTNVAPCENSYWVSKASLRSWRRLALEKFEDEDQQKITDTDTNSEVSMTLQSNGDEKHEDNTADTEGTSKDDDSRLGFNEDIICDAHGALCVEEGCRRLVLDDVWGRLNAYFPEAPEFKYGTQPCPACQKEVEEAEAAKLRSKTIAQEQRAALADLYSDKNRPIWSNKINTLYIVPKQFLDDWRKYLKEPLRKKPVTKICNSEFLCPHGGFLYEPETIGLVPSSEHLIYVHTKEWTDLQRFMEIDTGVSVRRINEESGHVTFITSPEICTDCQSGRLEAERLAESEYTNAVIFVRKVTPDNRASVIPEGTPGDIPAILEGPDSNKKEKSDPEFKHAQVNGKRKNPEPDGASAQKIARIDVGASRRSNRHRRTRGEKEVTVSSSTKLWDLKIKLMKEFSAAPMDQHLYLSGKLLFGDQIHIGELGVTPNSIVYLRIDEPCDDPMLLEDATKAATPETGFKGTGLLSGSIAHS